MSDIVGLKLRAMQAQDAALMLEWENDDKVRAVSASGSEPGELYTLDQITEFIASGSSLDICACSQVRFIIQYMGQAIGTADLFDYDSGPISAKVGVLIYPPDLRGKGLATAAIGQLIEFAKWELGLRKLTAQCHAQNLASVRLFERCGFLGQNKDELIEFEVML